MDVKAVGAGSQPRALDPTPENEQAMNDAINSIVISLAMRAMSKTSEQINNMKQTIDEVMNDD